MRTATIRDAFGRSLLLGSAWLVLAFLVLPMAVVLPVSLTDQRYLSLPKHGLSLQHYRTFFGDPAWLSSSLQSLLIATAATVLSVFVGGLCAVGCWRLGGRLASAIRITMLAPLIVPSIVQAVGMYRLWAAVGLYDSYLGLMLAHAIVGLPYVVITVSAALSTVDPRLEQAARSLGASMAQTVRLVIAPVVVPGLLSGALFAFASSFDELIIALFLTSRDISTLPKRIWEGIQEDVDPTVAAAAMLLIALTLILVVSSFVVRRAWSVRRSRRTTSAAARRGPVTDAEAGAGAVA